MGYRRWREKGDARSTKETIFVLACNLYFCSIQIVRLVDLTWVEKKKPENCTHD